MIDIGYFQENKIYHAPLAYMSLELMMDPITNVF